MFTIIAFSESQDLAGAFGNVAAVPDQQIKTAGDYIYINEFNRLLGGLACIGTTGTEARLKSPTINRVNPYYITPVELDIHPGAKVHHSVSPNQAFPLEETEGLEVEIYADPAAAEQESVVVWLANQEIASVKGNIICIKFTITLAQLAGEWSFSEITLIDEIPVGNYSVVGMRVVADGAVAARLVPVGGKNRPGCPCVLSKEEDGDEVFRRGNLGIWTEFSHNSLPGFELLGSAAVGSATYVCYLDIIKR